MFEFLKKNPRRTKLDRKILRKNNISLLIVDERWNSLFENTQKTPDIVASEEKVKELLKEQSRLTAEAKEIPLHKKACMDRIIQLTTEVFEKNNEQAKNEMQSCEKEIKRINERIKKIQEELDNVPELIKDANLELLEHTVNLVYFDMSVNQKRAKELEVLIEEAKAKLKGYIDEREVLSQDYTGIYTYFHELLGPEELERLDKELFK